MSELIESLKERLRGIIKEAEDTRDHYQRKLHILMNVHKLTDILTEAQARQVLKIYADAKPRTFASECEEKVIIPNITEINRKTGQENDTKFMAYLCEHLINQRLV